MVELRNTPYLPGEKLYFPQKKKKKKFQIYFLTKVPDSSMRMLQYPSVQKQAPQTSELDSPFEIKMNGSVGLQMHLKKRERQHKMAFSNYIGTKKICFRVLGIYYF